MFKMNDYMVAAMLNSLRNMESLANVNVNNQYLNARLYSGTDLTPDEVAAFESAGNASPTDSGFSYTRDYTSAFSTLASTRTLLAQTPTASSPTIQRFQNVGNAPDKSVWRLSNLAPLTAVANGTAGLLVLKMSSLATQVNLCRIVFAFSVGEFGSGADIELTSTTVSIGGLISLNDIQLEYTGLM
jgi:hypothetical protein